MTSAVVPSAQPEQILKGLGKLWTSLGEEEKQLGKPTVLRACAMTLIVATDENDGGFHASQTISDLVHEHPSRGIVVAISQDAKEDFQARVLAQCWKPFGKAQQICCEQIEITARSASWQNIGPILIGLTAADLPVVFWCRHQSALKATASEDERRGVEAVLDLATKMIVDTADFDTKAAFDLISGLRSRGRIVGDLAWTRLTQWREPIGHIFDNQARQITYDQFDSVEVTYTEAQAPVSALYLAGWLSAPRKAKVSLRQASGQQYGPGIHSVMLHSPSETITFERSGKECMLLRSTNGRERRYTYIDPNTTSLMTEELSIVGSDPAFNNAFTRAQELMQ